MRRTNTQTIKEAIDLFLEENLTLTDKLAELRLINSWGKILGILAERYTTNIYIHKKILYVGLSSAALKNELMMCREKLISQLNEEAGKEVIIDIVFK
ncbi:MAG: DUF721 domain-containing protein [Dysgonamonadaceae bacterium]|jgi:hypothetical protein|nr:DUF721 domain-containing protein [Dysgonamonadaceae bacterium]